MEQVQQDSYNKLKEENEIIKNKIFYLENIITKKDNIILILNKKYDRVIRNSGENGTTKFIEKEYFVIILSCRLSILHFQ